jgi:hypothetical protein
VAGHPVEITELTICNANIGGIHIPVNLPGYHSISNLFLPELIRDMHKLRQRSFIEKRHSFFNIEKLKLQRFYIEV